MSCTGFSREQLHNFISNLSASNWGAIEKQVQIGFFEGRIWKILRGDNQATVYKVIRKVNANFEQIEQQGVKVFALDQKYSKDANDYRNEFKIYFLTAKKIQQVIASIPELHPELKSEYQALQANLVGLRYRLGLANGGIKPLEVLDNAVTREEIKQKQRFQRNLDVLKTLALKWKSKEKLAINKNHLVPAEIRQLEEAAKYDKWVGLLDGNKEYRDEFFNWALRDANRVDVFILYRNTQKIIKKSLCAGLFGRIRRPGTEEILRIREVNTKVEGVKKRILSMPVYSGRYDVFEEDKQKWVNILKPGKVIHLTTGNFKLTLSQVWHELSQKNDRESKLNFCKWGLINFHPVHGHWDADKKEFVKPSMTKENWTQHVPPGDVVSQSELETRYGDKIKNRKKFYKITSTRQFPDLNALKCHGFWQIYIHMGNDKWRVLDVGVYAFRFQQGFLDGLYLFCATLRKVFAFIDQNGYYTQRQKATYPLFPSEENSDKISDRIWEISQKHGVFQFAGDNCSSPVQKSLEGIPDVPNFFRMRVTKAKIGFSPFDLTFAFLERCPARIRRIGIAIIHTLFGSFRTYTIEHNGQKIQYSVAKYFKDTEDMYHPAYLHYQIEEAHNTRKGPFVEGELSWGNLDFKA